MSYCVNCGVELTESQKRCPLCDTPVLNPKTFGKYDCSLGVEPKKSMETIHTVKVDFKLLATVISVLLIIPVAISVICNLADSGKLTWSLYVLGAIALFFVAALLPAFFTKKNPYLFILTDTAAAFLYLWLICSLCDGNWAFTLALPLCIITGIFALFFTLVLRTKPLSKLLKLSIFTLFSGLYTMATEVVISDFIHSRIVLHWSHLVLIPCAAVSVVLLILNSHKKLKNELEKKLFM